jgi:aconitate hydratase
VLALTFGDPADFDRLREDDRVNLLGLDQLVPGVPVECRVQHADGASETLWLRHSYTEPQVEWFRRGSALNRLSQPEPASSLDASPSDE